MKKLNINKIIELHRFFTIESKYYIGKPKYPFLAGQEMNIDLSRKVLSGNYKLNFKQKMYYPIAYYKFMYYMIKKLLKGRS